MATALETANRTDTQTVQYWLLSAQATGQRDTYPGKRRRPRFTWHVPITLEVLDASVLGRSVRAHCAMSRDISDGGMGLRCRQPVPVMALVCITLDETQETVYGRVRHCTGSLGGFLVGVEFVFGGASAAARRRSA